MTLLNEADAIYLGALEADRVYLGATQVWQKPTTFPVWAPTDITGLEVWLDASQLALGDGAGVSPWPNMGSGDDPTIVGTPAPVMKTNILNGLSVVRFSASQGRVRGRCSMVKDYTLIYVGRSRVGSGGRAFSSAYPEGANFLIGYHVANMDTMYDEGFLGPSKAATNVWKLYGADGEFVIGTYTSRFFINGVESGSKTGGGGLNTYYHLSGYSLTGTEETGDFDFAEFLIYDHKLPDAERIQVEDYLRAKWGL